MIPKNFNFITQLTKDLSDRSQNFARQMTQQLKQGLTENWETIEHQVPQLSLALDFLRPHVRALGLRVARLSRNHVEIILPSKFRNLADGGHVLEGAVVMAASEAFKWLWKQNMPEGNFTHEIRKINFEAMKPLVGNLRLRVELNELSRETALLELTKLQRSDSVGLVLVYGKDEQLVAHVEIESRLGLTPALDWT
jgi:hypothetical protein